MQSTINLNKVVIKRIGSLFPNGCSIIADYHGARIGYAHINLDGNIAILADIRIEDHYPMGKLFFRKRTYSFRGHGIGSQLLKRVILLCRNSGVQEIIGNLDGDLERLELWYAKHGFVITGEQISLKIIP